MPPDTTFKVSGKMSVAYVSVRGPYAGVGNAIGELKSWIDSHGVEQSGYPFCLFFDNPLETPEKDLRSEVCIPVSKAFAGEGKVQFKEIAQVDVAETRHEGPPEKFYMTYGPFLEGLLNQGYTLLGPAREFYMTVADVLGPGSGFLIQQPIAKK